MQYRISDIIKDVKIAMDENRTSEQLLEVSDMETLRLDEIIESKIEESVREIHLSAPNYLLECGHNLNGAVYWSERGSGWILLPRDFLRLVVFEMSDWEQPVYSAISTDDPEYSRQHSRFKGVRGTSQKPVCAIGVRPEGRVLEFYSCKSEEARVSRGVYVPESKIELGSIDISERCYRGVIYACASLVLTAIGDADKAIKFSELTKSAIS